MGIALDTTSDSGAQASVSTFSWTHIVGNGLANSILIVAVGASDAANANNTNVSSVTYGGVALTRGPHITESGAGNGAEIWYLIAPAAGSASIQVTLVGSCATSHAAGVSLSGVNQTTPTDGSNTTNAGQSLSIATTVDGDWIFDAAAVGTGNTGRINGFGAGQTALFPTSGTATQGASYSGPDTPAGTFSTSFTTSGFTQEAYVSLAIQPAPATASSGWEYAGELKVQRLWN
jgi:hypothetical protein